MKLKIDFRFFIILFSIIFKYIKLERNIPDKYSYIVLMILALISCIYIYRKKISNINMKQLPFWIVITCFSIFIVSDTNIFFGLLIALMFCDDDKPIKRIIVYYLISLLLIFSVTVIMGQLGIFKTIQLSRIEDGVFIGKRVSLGFSHPNTAFIYYFFILLALSYIIKNKKIFILVALVSVVIIYKFTLCRTGIISFIALLILINIPKIKFKKIELYFPLLTILTIAFALLWGDKYNELNIISSNRLYYWKYYVENGLIFNFNGISKDLAQFTLDSMFLQILVSMGIISYLIYMFIYCRSATIIKRNKKLSIIFIVTLIYATFESHIMNPGINFMLPIQILLMIVNKVPEEINYEKN